MAKGFTLYNGQGARLDVRAVHFIPPSRRRCEGANCAVIIGDVAAGAFMAGDQIALKDKSGKELLKDSVARLEINCRQCFEVPVGSHVGVLLKEHAPDKLLELGVPRYQAYRPPTAHPNRL